MVMNIFCLDTQVEAVLELYPSLVLHCEPRALPINIDVLLHVKIVTSDVFV